jgi:two-component system, NtrC family, nitrogen regulation response regulator GlnG
MRKSDPLFGSTIKKSDRLSTTRRATVPCLTVLAHPDPSRVGDRSALKGLLVGQSTELSRLLPLFSATAAGTPAPLADPHLSRTPMLLRAASGGIEIDPQGFQVKFEGTSLSAPRACRGEELSRGVVLELEGRVTLLLHHCSCRPLTSVEGLLGQSDAIEDVRRELLRVADLDTPVLVRGETGTGKEQVASAIHAHSKRKGGEYVAVNMATVPESVAISALFGHAKGAFTGALQRHRGLFERASGGTLMLDEIGETPENVQPMLLRAVETGKILPLGDETERTVEARFIAATDADLERELSARSFSAALLHRLAGYEIRMPALRDRREDIAVLLMHFLRQELARVGEATRLPELSELLAVSGFTARLCRHPLPGNVRQLRNIARHLVISNRGAEQPVITPAVERLVASDATAPSDLPPSLAASAQKTTSAGSTASPSTRPTEIDEDSLIEALRKSGWSPNRAAASLGIPTGTLHDLMRKSGRVRRAADLSDDELRATAEACGGSTQAMADALCVSERGLRITLRQRGLIEGE